MFKKSKIAVYFLFFFIQCWVEGKAQIVVGAQRIDQYLQYIKDKRIGMVVNQTSRINNCPLYDSLLHLGIKVNKLFSPEHGFSGSVEAGGKVKSNIDRESGIKIISLYGRKFKPSIADLNDLDVILFDIQDIGVRFYTYISTLHYLIEACAENKKRLIVLDRPNPNGFYIDGPVLDDNCRSFVGLDPIPIVYGLTIGEYALMVNGEHWTISKNKCDLIVIPMLGYTHNSYVKIDVNPSPNINSMEAVFLYPTLGLFEGTKVSVGRGTNVPFQVIGFPGNKCSNFSFKPQSIPRVCVHPPFQDTLCFGVNLKDSVKLITLDKSGLQLQWIKLMYKAYQNKSTFFNSFFKNLAGNKVLEEQIINDKSTDFIRASWEPQLSEYKLIRKKYLLYTD